MMSLIIATLFSVGMVALVVGGAVASAGGPINYAIGGAALLAGAAIIGRFYFKHRKDDAPAED